MRARLLNALEPAALIDHFLAQPPEGFTPLQRLPMPAFSAPFDLLTTADAVLKARLRRLPGYRWWSRWLTLDSAFVGTTVSEYALLPASPDPWSLARTLRHDLGSCHALTIIKDLPCRSPLLSPYENAQADTLARACADQGYVLVQGQALAYVPLDFEDEAAYLARLPKQARRYLQRKLRTREQLIIRPLATGAAFADPGLVDQYYALYEAVYAQSEIHFDRLSRVFFTALLRDESSRGVVFEYRRATDGELVGWNLCFEHDGRLIDKYIGLAYPASRELNLYFVSWMINLEYARERGLMHYVAGWTDPGVKALLGASFTPTRHAVFVRNPLLRALARRLAGRFEMDKEWLPPLPT